MIFKLKEIRKSKYLSRRELAILSGVNEQTIVALENAKNNPYAAKISTLINLAKALGVKVRDFYPEEEAI